MPKERVHWGTQYIQNAVPETDKHGGYYEELPFQGLSIDPNTGETEKLPTGNRLSRSPSVDIYWSKPGEYAPAAYDEEQLGSVQIGFDVNAAELDLFMEEWKQDRDLVSSRSFFTRGLTRKQINDMIKTLKRARDAAFGVDE